jgi:hypothetical protein
MRVFLGGEEGVFKLSQLKYGTSYKEYKGIKE